MQLQESYQKAAFEGSECPQTGPGSPKYRDFGDMRNWDVYGEMKKVGGEHELAIDSITLSGRPIVWEPHFTFHGFRYVQLEQFPAVHDGSDSIDTDNFTAIVIHTDMERTGWFECSEPLLNRLHENAVWSMRGNFVGVPTDCPQRDERLGWTGDLQAFAPAASFLYSPHGMLKTWLRGLAAEQHENGRGVPPLVSPDIFRGKMINPIAIWGDSTVTIPWDLYQSSGDVQVLSDQYTSMLEWLDRGVIRDGRRLWDANKSYQLADWLDPEAPPTEPGNGRTDNDLVANAFLIHSTDTMCKISSVLGLDEDQLRYHSESQALRREFSKEYVTASGRVVSDSQTALALALHFSLLASPEQETHAAERLAHIILSKSRFKIATGFAGTPILGHALTKVGKSQLFYRMLLHKKCPSFLYPVTMGATTTWERWDSMLPDGSINPGEMTSFNHYALGSVVHWMHMIIGGLQPLKPGWKMFLISPIPGGTITHAKVRHDSPYGMIEVSWEVQGDTLHLRASVPPNTHATIRLPGQAACEVGCGVYEMTVPYIAPEWPPLPKYPPFTPHDDDEP
ncbi:Alpha-rhamnosidase [Pleurostoma richardsiae]|uniref:alpha-L-rhamnosidase n=1 Tax=Pleurostoma richardsiae TaxID=41990 RepID=A0AA38RV20_9PEZI|nr:Alpha-rhamnosidase [Pleurostoma richardsiae]